VFAVESSKHLETKRHELSCPWGIWSSCHGSGTKFGYETTSIFADVYQKATSV